MTPSTSLQNECPRCGGTGWRPVETVEAKPGDRRKTPQVARCECRTGARTERLLGNARIPRRYENCELSSFRIEIDGKHVSTLARARLTAETYAENYPAVSPNGLIFFGNAGSGKTHLAIGIVKELMRKGLDCLFVDFRELLKQVRHSYNPQTAATEMSVLKPLLDVEMLILDDIGAEKDSEWVEETVGFILNDRYNREKAVIITTNLENAGPLLSRYDEPLDQRSDQRTQAKRIMANESLGDRVGNRIWSRLSETCKLVEIKSTVDYRQRAKRSDST